jgi:hypothetical protein
MAKRIPGRLRYALRRPVGAACWRISQSIGSMGTCSASIMAKSSSITSREAAGSSRAVSYYAASYWLMTSALVRLLQDLLTGPKPAESVQSTRTLPSRTGCGAGSNQTPPTAAGPDPQAVSWLASPSTRGAHQSLVAAQLRHGQCRRWCACIPRTLSAGRASS